MTDQTNNENHEDNLLGFLKRIHSVSLNELQASSPFLNHNVVNTHHNNANITYNNLGDYVKYDIEDCKNFPILLHDYISLQFESKGWPSPQSDKVFYEEKGLKYIKRLAKKIEKSIVNELNVLILKSIDIDNIKFVPKKSSIIASQEFIDDNWEFFNNFFNKPNDEKCVKDKLPYAWHIFHNSQLDVYISDLLSEEEAIFFQDGGLMVPFSVLPDQYPFPSVQSMDSISDISIQLTLGNQPIIPLQAFMYGACFGAGIFPGQVRKIRSKNLKRNIAKYEPE